MSANDHQARSPIPANRALSRVLRGQLGDTGGLRLIIGEALDSSGIDGSYTSVRIGGADYVIPKVRGTPYQIPAGRSVYILADADYSIMVALGYVSG
jgi:hypothetical protein